MEVDKCKELSEPDYADNSNHIRNQLFNWLIRHMAFQKSIGKNHVFDEDIYEKANGLIVRFRKDLPDYHEHVLRLVHMAEGYAFAMGWEVAHCG